MQPHDHPPRRWRSATVAGQPKSLLGQPGRRFTHPATVAMPATGEFFRGPTIAPDNVFCPALFGSTSNYDELIWFGRRGSLAVVEHLFRQRYESCNIICSFAVRVEREESRLLIGSWVASGQNSEDLGVIAQTLEHPLIVRTGQIGIARSKPERCCSGGWMLPNATARVA